MSRSWAALTALVLAVLLSPTLAAGQQQLLGNALLNLLNSYQTTRTVTPPACTPFKLPSGVGSFQEYCTRLSVANDTEWDLRYRNASAPAGNVGLPLQGCMLGCIVGADSYQRGLRWGAGTWSGKW